MELFQKVFDSEILVNFSKQASRTVFVLLVKWFYVFFTEDNSTSASQEIQGGIAEHSSRKSQVLPSFPGRQPACRECPLWLLTDPPLCLCLPVSSLSCSPGESHAPFRHLRPAPSRHCWLSTGAAVTAHPRPVVTLQCCACLSESVSPGKSCFVYTVNLFKNKVFTRQDFIRFTRIIFWSLEAFSTWFPDHSHNDASSMRLLSHFSRVQLFATPWTVAYQAPLCTGFSR